MSSWVVRPLAYVGGLGMLSGSTLLAVVRGRIHAGDTLVQLREIGVNSMPAVLATILFSSATFAYHLAAIVRDYGLNHLIGGLVGLATVREVAPVMVAVCVIARCGSAMAAELGTMKIGEQIDALRALSVSPVDYLVVPRVLATSLMMPVQYAYGLVVGILGGIAVSAQAGVTPNAFVTSMLAALSPSDVVGGCLKCVLFGLAISLICCESGLRAEGGARGVGRATTSAVVISLLAVYALNYIAARFLW